MSKIFEMYKGQCQYGDLCATYLIVEESRLNPGLRQGGSLKKGDIIEVYRVTDPETGVTECAPLFAENAVRRQYEVRYVVEEEAQALKEKIDNPAATIKPVSVHGLIMDWELSFREEGKQVIEEAFF